MYYNIISLGAMAALSTLAAAQDYQLVDLGALGGEAQAFAVTPAGLAAGAGTAQDSHFDAVLFGNTPVVVPNGLAFEEHYAFAAEAGDVIYGTSYDFGGLRRSAFKYDANGLVLLGDFSARGANDAGQVAGVVVVQTGGFTLERACRYSGGSVVTLETLGGLSSQGLAIDELGRVAGSSTTSAENGPRPCVWIGTRPVDMGTIGGPQGQIAAMKDGWAVGASQAADGKWHATRWHLDANGRALLVGDLGTLTTGASSFALGLNTLGDAVGTSGSKGVRWRNGVVTDLNTMIAPDPMWRIEKAWAINESGVIAGTARRLDTGFQHAVVLRPIGPYSGGGGGGGGIGGGDGGGGGAAAAAPHLDPASDLGSSSSDGLTAAKDLVFIGDAEVRATVRIVVDGVPTNRTATVDRAGHFKVKLSNAPEGRHEYRVTTKPRGGVESSPSDPLFVTKDSIAPATLFAPTLLEADRVVTNKPNEIATRNLRPTVLGTATAGNTVRLLSGSRVLAVTVADGNGNYSLQPMDPLRAGSNVSLKVVQMKPSGALSTKSRELKVRVVR